MHSDRRPIWPPSPPQWTASDSGALHDRVTTLEIHQDDHHGRIGKLEARMKVAADWARYVTGAGLLYLVSAGKMTVNEVLAIIKALADLLRALGGK